MKYKIKNSVISVHIGNKIYYKDSKTKIFDTKGNMKKYKAEIEAAWEAGFLQPIAEPSVVEIKPIPEPVVEIKPVIKEAEIKKPVYKKNVQKKIQ